MSEKNWLEGNIKYSDRFCQYAGRIRPGCTKCVAACPTGALHPERGCINIDKNACTDCGDCISVCPSGALKRKFGEVETIHREIASRAGFVIVFCDNTSWHNVVLPVFRRSLENIDGISPILLENTGFLSIVEFALSVHVSGKAVVIPALNDSDSHRAFIQEAELIGEITSLLFLRRMVHVPRTIEEFTTVMAQVTGWEQLMFPPLKAFPSDMNKRETLGTLIATWLRSIPDRDAAPSFISSNTFAKISCDSERCISCGACANQCKMGALQISSDGERLLHNPFLCVNCGVCTEVCPEQALSATPGLYLSRDFLNTREISHFQMMKCLSCGRPFTTEKKSRRVFDKLQVSLGSDPILEKLLRFCPKCRSVQAFTTFSQWTKERQ